MLRVLILSKQEKLNQMRRKADFPRHPITPSVTIDFKKKIMLKIEIDFFFFFFYHHKTCASAPTPFHWDAVVTEC